MPTFRVKWEIDVEAQTPEDAAREAHTMVRRPNTTANVYDVAGQQIDLSELDPEPKVFEISILWGESPEEGDEAQTYTFNTQAELDAFVTGVEESDGWMGYDIVEKGFVHQGDDD